MLVKQAYKSKGHHGWSPTPLRNNCDFLKIITISNVIRMTFSILLSYLKTLTCKDLKVT